MSWTPERENKLKDLWKKGHTASQIATIIGDTTRNAVIGKAHRLNLEARAVSKKSAPKLQTDNKIAPEAKPQKLGRKARFKALLLDKNFEAENPTIDPSEQDIQQDIEESEFPEDFDFDAAFDAAEATAKAEAQAEGTYAGDEAWGECVEVGRNAMNAARDDDKSPMDVFQAIAQAVNECGEAQANQNKLPFLGNK